MKSAIVSLAVLPAAAMAADVADLATADDNAAVELPGLLRFPVQAVETAEDIASLDKRQIGSDIVNQLRGFSYTIPLKIGTPGDEVSVVFDTGSSVLWVNPSCSNATKTAQCESFGRFSKSSTLQNLNTTGGVKYGTGYVKYDYVNDYVTLGSAKISQQVFGLATESSQVNYGIMGAGPSLFGFESNGYVIDSLAKQGFTKSRAFGVDLKGIESPRGSVVFGGVDTKKFRGVLEALPIIPASAAPDRLTRYWVNLDGISIGGESVSGKQAVFLDTGATLSYLPQATVDKIAAKFPGAKPTNYGLISVDCSVADKPGFVEFKFGKTTIKASYKDFIYRDLATNACLLGVAAKTTSFALGDSFLRSAYVVFDQDNKSLHVAQSDDCGTNLVSIGPQAVGPLEGECGRPKPSVPVSFKSSTSTTSACTSLATSVRWSSAVGVSSSVGVSKPASSSAINTSKASSAAPSVGRNTTISASASSSSLKLNTTSTASAQPTYTSTFTTTSVYTITSCAPTVTKCPVGKVTTKVITTHSTFCPTSKPPAASVTKPPAPLTTVIYTLIRCPGGKDKCPLTETGSKVVTASPVNPTSVAPVCKTCTTAPVAPKPTGVKPVVSSAKPSVKPSTSVSRNNSTATTATPRPPVATVAKAAGNSVILGTGMAAVMGAALFAAVGL